MSFDIVPHVLSVSFSGKIIYPLPIQRISTTIPIEQGVPALIDLTPLWFLNMKCPPLRPFM